VIVAIKSRAVALLLSSLVIFWIIGCSTVSFESTTAQSFAEIQKGVGETFPRGIGDISSNQREYTSKYFRLSELGVKEDLNKKGDLRRAQALVIVLGDRRPYTVEVHVHTEVRNDESAVMKIRKGDIEAGHFTYEDTDRRLAKRLAERLQDFLYRRSQNKNFIDDFRPF
jgi:hypothetical protein